MDNKSKEVVLWIKLIDGISPKCKRKILDAEIEIVKLLNKGVEKLRLNEDDVPLDKINLGLYQRLSKYF